MSLKDRYGTITDESKTSREILSQIRELMRDQDVVGSQIHAYIITSVDAHQVLTLMIVVKKM